MLEKIPAEQIDPAWYSSHGVPLVGAFVSEVDRTLQFYSLTLPYDWQPDRAYFLTMYLHGYGTPYPVEGLKLAFDCRQQDTLFTWDAIDPDAVPALHQGFLLAPWGRGNAYYLHGAAQDLLQALWEVEQRFAIDTDRRYLSGFSMGGHGSTHLAL